MSISKIEKHDKLLYYLNGFKSEIKSCQDDKIKNQLFECWNYTLKCCKNSMLSIKEDTPIKAVSGYCDHDIYVEDKSFIEGVKSQTAKKYWLEKLRPLFESCFYYRSARWTEELFEDWYKEEVEVLL